MKIGSICSGMGMALHGLGDIVWSVEYDSAIAEIYKQNHPHSQIFCSKVENINPQDLADIDCIIATPSCVRASIANNAIESLDDISVAQAISNIISIKSPKFFILENVEGYKNFESFKIIQDSLSDYYNNFQILNLKDFGIAQNRKRLYLMAVKNGFFLNINIPKINAGWYTAIEDLIPALPDTQLLKWQVKTPNSLVRRCGANKSNNRPYSLDEPCFTIRAFGRKADNHWHQVDININGKVKIVTPQACLRFFGDKETADKIWLPQRKCLANEVVGNGASWEIMSIILNHISQS